MDRFRPTLAAVLLIACGNTPETPTEATTEPEAATAPAVDETEAAASAQQGPGDAMFAAPPDVAAPPADAQRTPSGLAYKVLEPGKGDEKPSAASSVMVHYVGWTTDGEMFDSSYKRKQPARFPLQRVISGWTEGLQLMSKGEKTRFWIPKELAYNDAPGKPAGMLVFDVELLDFLSPAPVPADVAAPPSDAKTTASGLAYKVLEEGEGTTSPTTSSLVSVHYTGWTTDGQMFDTSARTGAPASFTLDRVIPGWTEGLQLMNPGDQYRFWIPEALAYKGRPGMPAGMLVFDVELLEHE